MTLAELLSAVETIEEHGGNVMLHLPRGHSGQASAWAKASEETQGGVGWMLLPSIHSSKEARELAFARTVCGIVHREETPGREEVARGQLTRHRAQGGPHYGARQCRMMAKCAHVLQGHYEHIVHILRLDHLARAVWEHCMEDWNTMRMRAFACDLMLRAMGLEGVLPMCTRLEVRVPYSCASSKCEEIVCEMRRRAGEWPSAPRRRVVRGLLDASVFGGLPGELLDRIVDSVHATAVPALHDYLTRECGRQDVALVASMAVAAFNTYGIASIDMWRRRLMRESAALGKIERVLRGDEVHGNMPILNTLVVCGASTQRRLVAAGRDAGLAVGVPRAPYGLSQALTADVVCVRPSAVHELWGTTFRRLVIAHDVTSFETTSGVCTLFRWLFRIRNIVPVARRPMPRDECAMLFVGGGPCLAALGRHAFVLVP